MIIIRNATIKDKEAWLNLRKQLWPRCKEQRHYNEMESYLGSAEKCVLLACLTDGTIVGFCELTLRHDYVEGATTSPVAYLEGIFVLKTHRKLGIAKLLTNHAQTWAKQYSCTEIGSDAEIDNEVSINMHIRLGFVEKSRIVHFIKLIT